MLWCCPRWNWCSIGRVAPILYPVGLAELTPLSRWCDRQEWLKGYRTRRWYLPVARGGLTWGGLRAELRLQLVAPYVLLGRCEADCGGDGPLLGTLTWVDGESMCVASLKSISLCTPVTRTNYQYQTHWRSLLSDPSNITFLWRFQYRPYSGRVSLVFKI